MDRLSMLRKMSLSGGFTEMLLLTQYLCFQPPTIIWNTWVSSAHVVILLLAKMFSSCHLTYINLWTSRKFGFHHTKKSRIRETLSLDRSEENFDFFSSFFHSSKENFLEVSKIYFFEMPNIFMEGIIFFSFSGATVVKSRKEEKNLI